jgi:hypothetical protein
MFDTPDATASSLVDERQHLFGLGLGNRQEAGAEPGSGEDGLADALFQSRASGRASYFRVFSRRNEVWTSRTRQVSIRQLVRCFTTAC